ncbi:cytochrome c-type biogenesis protein [Piscinibacter koreensis]|uniref:Cytochrome c-type biogenesis protein n=1 Tax=Piscinibacter koreensis TaxID=2742824 RepID=A0A7Y6NPU1_9BURK|nr:cytochrome c-type biogenesis protein [Schlegelella koreensis]NUZ07135.1 cytochrome c-type biogenesis protein CcmH [Schlegelella koreensis]
MAEGAVSGAARSRTRALARLGWLVLLAAVLLASSPVHAKEAAPAVEDPVLEARVMKIAAELRCLVCQNQTIADSHADLAVDLRRQVREALRRGDSERQIIDYMTARYGDFVLYRPPLRADTALLWFGPTVLLVAGLATLFLILRRRSRLAADRFEPDDDLDADDEHVRIRP